MVSNEKYKEILDQTKMLVNLFLETNASDIELSKMTGISSSTVGRRLTDKEKISLTMGIDGEKIYELVKEMRQNNLKKGKIRGGQISQLNNVYLKDENNQFAGMTKLRIDLFFDEKDAQMKFLLHLALTYRAKLELLAQIFGLNEKELLEDLILISGKAYESLLYLFYHDNTDQNIARKNIIYYYRELLNANRKNDLVLQKNLISQVTDIRIRKILEAKKRDNLTDQDIEDLLKYQLKYALSGSKMQLMFGIDKSIYEERIIVLLEQNEELRERFQDLMNYHMTSMRGKHV